MKIWNSDTLHLKDLPVRAALLQCRIQKATALDIEKGTHFKPCLSQIRLKKESPGYFLQAEHYVVHRKSPVSFEARTTDLQGVSSLDFRGVSGIDSR